MRARLDACEKASENYRNKMLDMYAERQQEGKFFATYTFSDHDFQRYGNDKQGMQKNAVRVMSEAIGRKIVRHFKPDEIVEDGVLVGYRIEVEARKATDNT